jgi:CelD/BcsL family acetyltransferase involved in cellulose biosynthesis
MYVTNELSMEVQSLSVQQTEDWRESHCAHKFENFMQMPAWIRGAWENFHRYQPGVDQNLGFHRLVGLAADNTPIGGLAWYRQFRHGMNWWKLVGSGAICSDYVSPNCWDGFELSFANKLAEYFDGLVRNTRGFSQGLEIEGHLSTDVFWDRLIQEFKTKGWLVSTSEIEGGWRVDLPTDWRRYEEMLHRSRRRKARRAVRMFEDGLVELRVCRSAEEISKWWPEFVRLHQMRRELLNQPGCFSSVHFENFLRNATLELAQQNCCALYLVCHHSEPIAALLVFESSDTSFTYQSGIDVSKLNLEPGHIVNAAAIQDAIARGQRRFDFMRGDEAYKAGWLAQRIPLYRTRLFPPSLVGRGIVSVLGLQHRIRKMF